jgi:hypothetical protein
MSLPLHQQGLLQKATPHLQQRSREAQKAEATWPMAHSARCIPLLSEQRKQQSKATICSAPSSDRAPPLQAVDAVEWTRTRHDWPPTPCSAENREEGTDTHARPHFYRYPKAHRSKTRQHTAWTASPHNDASVKMYPAMCMLFAIAVSPHMRLCRLKSAPRHNGVLHITVSPHKTLCNLIPDSLKPTGTCTTHGSVVVPSTLSVAMA